MQSYCYFTVLFIYLLFSSLVHAVTPIRISDAAYRHDSIELIQLLLDATVAEYGEYEFQIAENVSQGRATHELENQRLLDLISFATSLDREKRLLPIRIPIDMGLLGYRVCLINKDEADKFVGVSDLKSWQDHGLSIGQGEHWPDTKILEKNKLQTHAAGMYESIFQMLRKKRFDCFSRSIIEVNYEINKPENQDLIIEQNILFIYPMPAFIFVNKNNTKLAERLTKGFELIRQDGSYYDYMQRKRFSAIKDLNLEKRHIIRLYNPFLSDETKEIIKDKSLWYDPNNDYTRNKDL